MNVVYASLRTTDTELLKRMWLKADPYNKYGALLRYQISVVIDRRRSGVWTEETTKEN